MTYRYRQVIEEGGGLTYLRHGYGLSPSELFVLDNLIKHDHPRDGCFPKQETIAHETGLPLRTVKAALKRLADAEIGPVPTDGGGYRPEAEMERLSHILREFNDRFGNIEWQDQDKIEKIITEELPAMVAEDRAYQNAKANSDRQSARIEHDRALERAMMGLLAEHTELFKQFSDSGSFRRWLLERSFSATYDRVAGAGG